MENPDLAAPGTSPSKTERLKSKASNLAHEARAKAGEAGEAAASYVREHAPEWREGAKATLHEQWQQIRQQAPDIVYASVPEAIAANARRTEANLAYYRENPSMIGRRMAELDDEWDTSRVLQVATSSLTLASFWLTLTKSKLWTLLSLVLAGGALHHGLTRASPAEDIVRRLGFRTRDEIEYERRRLGQLESDLGRDDSLIAQTQRDLGGTSGMTVPSMG